MHWIQRFIYFHGKRHPLKMGEAEVGAFLTPLAVKEKVAESRQNQNQALSTLVLCTHVIHKGGRGVHSPRDGVSAPYGSLPQRGSR